MRKNKKGFTLIELLAVIVILAVLILLAMPAVLKMMENARKGAFVTEANSILRYAETAYTDKLMSGTEIDCISVDELNGEYMKKNLNGYSGSVGFANSGQTLTLWLSNGTYYIFGSSAPVSPQIISGMNAEDVASLTSATVSSTQGTYTTALGNNCGRNP